MNKEKIKITIAWILLIILLCFLFYMIHIKFFRKEFSNANIEEIPVENSSSEAIELALSNIVDNFNKNSLIEQYKNDGINISALLSNNSIYINYETDVSTTYEFNYSNLNLTINISDEEENKNKFNKVYEILIKSIQERIGNENDITNIINTHLNEGQNYEGLITETSGEVLTYKIDITKQLAIEEGSE